MPQPMEQRLGKPSKKLINKLLVAFSLLVVGTFAWRQYTGKTLRSEQQQAAETAQQQKVVEAAAINPAEVARQVAEQEASGRQSREAELRERERLLATPTRETRPPLTTPRQSGELEPVPELNDGEAKSSRANLLMARASKLAFHEPGPGGGQPSGAVDAPKRSGNASGYPSLEEIEQQAQQVQRAMGGGNPSNGGGGLTAMRELARSQQSGSPTMNMNSPGNRGTLTQVSQDFLSQAAAGGQQDIVPLQATRKVSDFVLYEETIVKVALTRRLNSDLPGGSCQGRVIEDVYDSINMQYVLIPKDTKINCVYNSEVIPGQSRILFAFTRMIFPNGSSVRLGAMPGSDRGGAAGVAAEVDKHFWEIFGSSLVIGSVVLASNATSRTSTNLTVNIGGGYAGGGTQLATQVLGDVAKRMLDRHQNIKPTLSLGIGDTVAFVVKRDLLLDPSITGGWKAF